MKIIFALPSMGSGGAERVVSILSNEFVEMGHSVDIALLYTNKQQYQLNPKVKVYYLDLLGKSILSRASAIRHFLKCQRQECKNVVLIPMLDVVLNICLLARIGLNIPVIACERNNPYVKGTSFIKKAKAILPYWLSDFCIFQTPDARKYYSIIPDNKTKVIINPISLPNVSWKGDFSPTKLISVCRLHKQKNLPMTLSVIERLRESFSNIHLDIYGEGELHDDVEKMILERNLQDNISLRGTTKEVPKALSESSLFISTSDFEGISNSMLEAMAVGVPMVCTDCPIGGARLMLGNGAGVLSPVGDIDTFATKIANLLFDPSSAFAMSKVAKSTVIQYTPANIAKSWIEVINRLSKDN